MKDPKGQNVVRQTQTGKSAWLTRQKRLFRLKERPAEQFVEILEESRSEQEVIDTDLYSAKGDGRRTLEEVGSLKEKAADQHLIEMRSNREAWEKKPLLRSVYGQFYALIRENLARVPGAIVELGSGIGAIKSFIPECTTTDIFRNPWIDRRENAYALNFSSGTVSNLILLDVFHHLRFPGTALAEFWRVLADGGRVIVLEPGMGVLGKIIYGLFHHEPLRLGESITWFAPEGFDPESAGYYAAQGNAWRVFVRQDFGNELGCWRLIRAERLPEFAYVASGGFSGPQLYPKVLLPLIRNIERAFARWPELSATRLLVVLEKKSR